MIETLKERRNTAIPQDGLSPLIRMPPERYSGWSHDVFTVIVSQPDGAEIEGRRIADDRGLWDWGAIS